MRKKFATLHNVFLATVVSVLAFTVTGCDNKNTSLQASPKSIILHVGYENAEGEPFDLGCRKWQELVNTRSHGEIQIKLYPSSTLGTKSEIMNRMSTGEAVSTLTDGAFCYEHGIYDMGIVFGPFLFNNWEEAFRLHRSAWYHQQAKQLEEKAKIKMISTNWRYGARHTLSVNPITKIEDFEGLKIRVPTNIIQIKGMEVLDAFPKPLQLAEVYNALKNGEIDAVENPLSVLYGNKFHEVAKNLLVDSHIYNITNIAVSSEFWNTLTPKQQGLLKSTCDEAALYQNQMQDKAENELLKKFEAAGVKVTFPDELFRIELKTKSLKFYTLPDFSKWSPNLYEIVNKAMRSEQ